jgi:MFS family permease
MTAAAMDAAPPRTAGEEFARAWPVLVAALIGFGLGLSALPYYTSGVFVKPLSEEFGWTAGQIQTSLALMPIGTVLMAPVIGWAADRFGSKPVIIISMCLYIVSLAAIGQVTNANIMSFYAAWAAMAIVGAGTLAIPWTRAVNGWFDKGRGLALGLALAGSGLTGFLVPAFITWAIGEYGWRTAYAILAALPLVFALPLAILFFRDPPRPAGGAGAAAALAGLTAGESLKTSQFWIMAVAFFMISVGVGALIPNMVPILIKDGFDPTVAAQVAGLIGLSVIVGRIVAGFLIDRIWAPIVAFIFLIVPALSCVILANPQWGLGLVMLAAALVGLAAGAEFDLIAFMTSRYFGMKAYGKIYAWQFIGFGIGAGFAGPIPGMVLDATGSYNPALYVIAGLFVAGSAMLLFLGRYRFAAGSKH